MRIDGSCHCGSITYEADIDAGKVAICHCTDCQILSGTAFRITAPVREEDFHLLRGVPAQYTKTAESGRARIQAHTVAMHTLTDGVLRLADLDILTGVGSLAVIGTVALLEGRRVHAVAATSGSAGVPRTGRCRCRAS